MLGVAFVAPSLSPGGSNVMGIATKTVQSTPSAAWSRCWTVPQNGRCCNGIRRDAVNRVLGRLPAKGVVTGYKIPVNCYRYDR